MAVNLFAKISDDPSLNTKDLKFIISHQAREFHVRLGIDITHIISIYSITYNWHGKFKWLKNNISNQPYSLFPIQTDAIIPIKSIDFQEIYIVHCSTPNSKCYNYHPYKDKFYEFISPKPTYSRYSHATLISDGRIVSIGGSTKHIDIYDPRDGAWINHNYTENVLDFGDKCCIVQDELNSNIVHVVGGKNIVCNAIHSLDIRNGFKIVDRNEICIERENDMIPLERLTAHAAVMSDQNQMVLFGGRSLSGVFKVNLSKNAMDQDDNRFVAEWIGVLDRSLLDQDDNRFVAEWIGALDRSLFGYDITPDRKYLVVAGGYEYASFKRRSTINVLDLASVDEGNYPINFMPNLRLKLEKTMTAIGIATLDDTIHVFGGFDGHYGTNVHWVAKTRDIVIGSEY
eukprot:CAMPEP_0201592752 /NCGR_PEP_ID=MMETSP0190_2-20130828/190560_1 /ASSEMBLY_ACC=CAM_ASM_000263 /TAXON_ID=37353 /ORGANISM="Rosalina sp." /LENGTH=399 /DNA_ID=CAMNT_0048051661 /DNA_START=21 /DNA_END=1220 /DNA_ORIENTATION=+